MTGQQLDLSQVFQIVASALAQDRDNLSRADAYNSNHGDNIVQAFQTITMALAEKQNAPQGKQLAHASQKLTQQPSGSAQFYAQGLAEAARESKQGKLDAADAVRLAQVLLGGGKPAGSDAGLDNVLAGVMGALGGGSSPGRGKSGTSDDLVSAGVAFLASPQGQQLVASLLQSLTAGEQKQPAPHRAESGALIAGTLMQAIGALTARR
ncbi:MAG: hypothetical protein MUO23_13140 [Anaerolineales bacterium]|nr:hypothetical protein [Anaerolineales bacterium]